MFNLRPARALVKRLELLAQPSAHRIHFKSNRELAYQISYRHDKNGQPRTDFRNYISYSARVWTVPVKYQRRREVVWMSDVLETLHPRLTLITTQRFGEETQTQHTHARIQTHTNTTHTCTHTNTQKHTHARNKTHTHTHLYIVGVGGRDGASPATLRVFNLNSDPYMTTKQQYGSTAAFFSSSACFSNSLDCAPSLISLISRMSTRGGDD